MDFWDRLRAEVKRNNTTQEWVAEQVGGPFGTFRKWLARRTMPNADQMLTLAKVLGTSVESLMAVTDDSGPPINPVTPFSKRLWAAINDKGISLTSLSIQAQVPEYTIRWYLSGVDAPQSVLELGRMTGQLGCTMDYLAGFTSAKSSLVRLTPQFDQVVRDLEELPQPEQDHFAKMIHLAAESALNEKAAKNSPLTGTA